MSVMAEVLAVKNDVPLPRDFNVALAKEALLGPALLEDEPQVCFTATP